MDSGKLKEEKLHNERKWKGENMRGVRFFLNKVWISNHVN